MKALVRRSRVFSGFVYINMDQFLVPLLIVAALTLAGMIFGYATTH
jgi:hypothetical protein